MIESGEIQCPDEVGREIAKKLGWRASPRAGNEIGVARLAGRTASADDRRAVRRRRLPLGACEPVLKSGVGAFAGTPVCCLEHALQLRLITRGSRGRRSWWI